MYITSTFYTISLILLCIILWILTFINIAQVIRDRRGGRSGGASALHIHVHYGLVACNGIVVWAPLLLMISSFGVTAGIALGLFEIMSLLGIGVLILVTYHTMKTMYISRGQHLPKRAKHMLIAMFTIQSMITFIVNVVASILNHSIHLWITDITKGTLCFSVCILMWYHLIHLLKMSWEMDQALGRIQYDRAPRHRSHDYDAKSDASTITRKISISAVVSPPVEDIPIHIPLLPSNKISTISHDGATSTNVRVCDVAIPVTPTNVRVTPADPPPITRTETTDPKTIERPHVEAWSQTQPIVKPSSPDQATSPRRYLHHSRSIRPSMRTGVVGSTSRFKRRKVVTFGCVITFVSIIPTLIWYFYAYQRLATRPSDHPYAIEKPMKWNETNQTWIEDDDAIQNDHSSWLLLFGASVIVWTIVTWLHWLPLRIRINPVVAMRTSMTQ